MNINPTTLTRFCWTDLPHKHKIYFRFEIFLLIGWLTTIYITTVWSTCNWQSWSLNLTENALELQRTDVLYWKINLCTFCCPPFSTVILSPTMPLPLYPWTAISASCPSPSNIMPIGVLLSPDVSSLLVSLFLIPRILSEAWIIVTKRNMLKHLINLMVLCKFCTILVMFLQKITFLWR